jgi:hypothetical protein
MGVIDDTQERSLLSRVGQQTEDRQADQKRIRDLPRTQSERDRNCVALGLRETLHELEYRSAQLLQRRKRQLHLPLDPGGSYDPKLRPSLDGPVQ